MALVKKVCELFLFEHAELGEQLFDFLVGGIDVGDILDLFNISRHFVFFDTPVFGLPGIMGDEKRGIGHPGIVFPLGVILGLDGHVIGLALHNNERRFLVDFILSAAPDHKISPGLGTSPTGNIHLLRHLICDIAIFLCQNPQVLLANTLLRGQWQPFLSYRAEYLIAFDLNFICFDIAFSCHASLPKVFIFCHCRHSCNIRFRFQ